ncbi:MAG: hypothetical protein WD895_07000 [Acidimicrobiia bacterium]
MTLREPDLDVSGIAIPTIDSVLNEARSFLGDDPVVATMRDVISPEAFEDYNRASDLLLVVTILRERVGMPEAFRTARFTSASWAG